MIKYDGYYQDEPTPYEDSVANYKEQGYFHHAYLFFPNGKYLRAVKKTKNERVEFFIQDFNADFPNNYKIIENELKLTFHTGEKWEFNEIVEIISETLLLKNNKHLQFKQWKE